jgi:hypothetical protein
MQQEFERLLGVGRNSRESRPAHWLAMHSENGALLVKFLRA